LFYFEIIHACPFKELQWRLSWTILNHCADICLQKLKKPIKHTKSSNPAEIQANAAYIGRTSDHHIAAVPSKNPNCRINHSLCKRLPHIYINYI
jgi:hypothetical protein